jgi:hypothetical protein
MGFRRVLLRGRVVTLLPMFGRTPMRLGGVLVMLGRCLMRAGSHLHFSSMVRASDGRMYSRGRFRAKVAGAP